MSSAAATVDRGQTPPGQDRPGLVRLAGVELRKMVDTRAGFWLLLSAAAITIVFALGFGLSADASERSLQEFLSILIQPGTLFLSIIGILLVASEWTQRTTLNTFSLVPDRTRVIVAKVVAGVGIGVLATALVFVLSAVSTAVFGGEATEPWSLSAAVAGQITLYMIVSILIGVAFGAAFLASAPAIVTYFVFPFAIGAAVTLSFLEGVGPWIDQQQAYMPMVEGSLSGEEWGHVATSTGVWFLLPMAIGWWRIQRSEVN